MFAIIPEAIFIAQLAVVFVVVVIVTTFRSFRKTANERERVEQQERNAVSRQLERQQAMESLNRARHQAVRLIKEITSDHIETLRVKRLQLLQADDYGIVITRKWHEHLDYYEEAVLTPRLMSKSVSYALRVSGRELYSLIDSLIDTFEKQRGGLQEDVDNLAPLAFESYCAKVLARSGWRARTTAGSGDQGVDVVADRDSIRAVFQCKKWSSPIGNKAVQEIIAGREFYEAALAFVVSTTGFTPKAIELAKKCNVFLIHYSELDDLNSYVKQVKSKKQSGE